WACRGRHAAAEHDEVRFVSLFGSARFAEFSRRNWTFAQLLRCRAAVLLDSVSWSSWATTAFLLSPPPPYRINFRDGGFVFAIQGFQYSALRNRQNEFGRLLCG